MRKLSLVVGESLPVARAVGLRKARTPSRGEAIPKVNGTVGRVRIAAKSIVRQNQTENVRSDPSSEAVSAICRQSVSERAERFQAASLDCGADRLVGSASRVSASRRRLASFDGLLAFGGVAGLANPAGAKYA